jgi:hypothetical protein
MKGAEIMWNSYGNPIIQKVFGIPLIFNMTQTFKTGPGYTIKEVAKYISFNKKSLLKSIKDKIFEERVISCVILLNYFIFTTKTCLFST